MIEPVRLLAPAFAATEYVAVPLPDPLPAAVMVIHASLLTAGAHVQPVALLIVAVPVPPDAPKDVGDADTESEAVVNVASDPNAVPPEFVAVARK